MNPDEYLMTNFEAEIQCDIDKEITMHVEKEAEKQRKIIDDFLSETYDIDKDELFEIIKKHYPEKVI